MALDTALRVLGTTLEVVGIGLAAWGIRSTRRTWAPDVPGVEGRAKAFAQRMWTRVRGWLGIRRQHIISVGSSIVVVSSGGARGTVSLGRAQRRRSLRQRVRRLEGDLRRVEQRMNQADGASFDRDEKLEAAIKAEAEARDELAVEHKQMLRDLAAGSLRLEASGLAMILFGVLLANLSAEIANLMRSMFL